MALKRPIRGWFAMAETRGDNEPSMEEILASIRRIISEDTEPRRSSGAPGREGEVLDLTEMLTADGSVVSLASRRAGAAPGADAQGEPPAPEQPSAAKQDAGREGGSSAKVQLYEQEHNSVMSEAEARASLVSDTAVDASTASLGRLARAVRREAALRALSGGDEDRRVEDLVRESMAPMLKEWLDRNLPQMVERVVREEIEKMVRRLQES
jgi:cell pole-organizing protein PopZ